MNGFRVKEALLSITLLGLFVVVSFYSRSYESEILGLFDGNHANAAFLYTVIIVATFVVAPLNALPLMPVTVVLWGPIWALLINLVAWSLGTLVTYYLSRTFGRPLVLKFVKESTIMEYEEKLTKNSKFIGLVVLHAILPGDILGYALGIFVRVPYFQYTIASFVGNIPIGISLIYAASLSMSLQIAVLAGIVAITYIYLWHVGKSVFTVPN